MASTPPPDAAQSPPAAPAAGAAVAAAPLQDRAASILRIPGVKLAMISLLLLVMLIPTMMVENLIQERQTRQNQVERQFAQSWGPPQSVIGPLLVIPYRVPTILRDRATTLSGVPQDVAEVRGYVQVAPAQLGIATEMQPETKKRGFFRAIVYRAQLKMTGTFRIPELSVRGAPGAQLLWDEASLILGANDLRAMRADTRVSWGGTSVPFGSPSRDRNSCAGLAFVAATLPANGTLKPGAEIPFETALDLRGVRGFHIVPTAARLQLSVTAPWPSPSFNGAALPVASSVTPEAFRAEWDTPGAAGAAPFWSTTELGDCRDGAINAYSKEDQVGVDLLEEMPTYRMVDRASKYTMLFLVLCFLTYFLFEMLTRVAIGLVQYGLMGLSLSLFALLLVSFGEPLGFAPAYAISAALVGVQGTLYTAAITRRIRLATIFAAVQAALFGFLYVVLGMETYALLAGSVTLFAVLSVVMVVTRRIDFGARPA